MNNMGGKSGGGFYQEKIPKGYETAQQQVFSPEQMQLFQQQFSHVGPDSFLSRLAGGDQSMYDEMEAPAMRQFSEMQGQNASRFSGMGMGARRGSGFQNEMGQQTANFAQDLQSKRMALRQQAINDLMGLSHQLLGERPMDRQLVQKPQQEGSGWGQTGGMILGGVAGLVGSGGNPLVAMGTAQMGGQLMKNF